MKAEIITSRQNQRVKDAAKLRDHRQRVRQDRFLIDGVRELGLALDAGIELTEVFVCPAMCKSAAAQPLLARLPHSGAIVSEATPEVFEKLAYGDRAEGVLAVARTPHNSPHDWQLSDDSLVAVLVGIEKPGNVGAVLRSADAAGVAALLVVDGRTDLYNPNAIRASLGTIFRVRTAEVSTAESLAWLRERRFTMYAARPDAGRSYTDASFRGNTALILGSEAAGLSSDWNAQDVTPIALPMHGAADSLNVSATASILFYEALRQRSGE